MPLNNRQNTLMKLNPTQENPMRNDSSSTQISLEESALRILLSNRVLEHYEIENKKAMDEYDAKSISKNETKEEGRHVIRNNSEERSETIEYSFIAPCSEMRTIQESTSTLVSARALAKAGYSEYAWDEIHSLFAVQGSNGFLPRYRYPPDYISQNQTIENCFPMPPSYFFNSYSSSSYQPSSSSLAAEIGLKASGRISAPPFHASYILDVFYLSNQTDSDLSNLANRFQDLYKWHQFLHQMFGQSNLNEDGNILFNIVHPWESEIEIYNPFWKEVLLPVIEQMNTENWEMKYIIPPEVKERKDYPGDEVYNAAIYLLECMENCTSLVNETYSLDHAIYEFCQFSMIDISYASALAKADEDLIEIGDILRDKDSSGKPTTDQAVAMKIWASYSSTAVASLFNYDDSSFFSQISFKSNNITKKKDSISIDVPIVQNFMPLYGLQIADPDILHAISYQLLGMSSYRSFNCGKYPLWTYSCSSKDNQTDDYLDQTTISPILNQWIFRGLIKNINENDLEANYIRNSTLNLVCGLPNNEFSNYSYSCPNNSSFGVAYDIINYEPFCSDACSESSSLTAAVIYDTIVPDAPFQYSKAPPLTNVAVLILIVLELAVAFAIGVTCLALSLNIMRRLKADDDFDIILNDVSMNESTDALIDLYGADSRLESGASNTGSDEQFDLDYD